MKQKDRPMNFKNCLTNYIDLGTKSFRLINNFTLPVRISFDHSRDIDMFLVACLIANIPYRAWTQNCRIHPVMRENYDYFSSLFILSSLSSSFFQIDVLIYHGLIYDTISMRIQSKLVNEF